MATMQWERLWTALPPTLQQPSGPALAIDRALYKFSDGSTIFFNTYQCELWRLKSEEEARSDGTDCDFAPLTEQRYLGIAALDNRTGDCSFVVDSAVGSFAVVLPNRIITVGDLLHALQAFFSVRVWTAHGWMTRGEAQGDDIFYEGLHVSWDRKHVRLVSLAS